MEESNEYLRAIRRNWPIPLVAMVLGLVAMFFTTPAKPHLTPVAYRATHTILIAQHGGEVNFGAITINQITLFATTGEVPRRVSKKLH